MRYNLLEHADMAVMREKHPEWIWNRSDTHVFLGVPGTLDDFKTVVEPGNSFSPGPRSYGVSAWVYADGERTRRNGCRWSGSSGASRTASISPSSG